MPLITAADYRRSQTMRPADVLDTSQRPNGLKERLTLLASYREYPVCMIFCIYLRRVRACIHTEHPGKPGIPGIVQQERDPWCHCASMWRCYDTVRYQEHTRNASITFSVMQLHRVRRETTSTLSNSAYARLVHVGPLLVIRHGNARTMVDVSLHRFGVGNAAQFMQ